MNITNDLKRLSRICYLVGYMGARAERDNYADEVVGYITDLFNAKREIKFASLTAINKECKGCTHQDEIGRCLNFMLAKDDRSCWEGKEE